MSPAWFQEAAQSLAHGDKEMFGILGVIVVQLGSLARNIVTGRKKDTAHERQWGALSRRLDEHAASDTQSFNKIDTTLQLLDQTLREGIRGDVRELKAEVKALREDVTELMVDSAKRENH